MADIDQPDVGLEIVGTDNVKKPKINAVEFSTTCFEQAYCYGLELLHTIWKVHHETEYAPHSNSQHGIHRGFNQSPWLEMTWGGGGANR